MTEYKELLKEWMEKLLELQLKSGIGRQFDGGILCPACIKVHGRSMDSLFAFLYMAKETGEEKYREGAEKLFWWAERNVMRPDGSMINDPNNDWRGVTVFMVVQLAESLFHFEDLLLKETLAAARRRLIHASDYLYRIIDGLKTNINYLFGCGLALELSGAYLKEEKYREKGKELIYRSLNYIDEQGLIFGEGNPPEVVTAKGCRAIDIGYNVEESLPSLVQYSISAGDPHVRETAVRAMKAHMNFFLPDGGWDNSLGTRNAKWTYWGSRTSDGCQLAYGALGKEEPEFMEVARRNLALYKKCTRKGLLYGGPMYEEAGEEACVHHTICHAKALAMCLAKGYFTSPYEERDSFWKEGIQDFNKGQVLVARSKDWYLSSSASDYQYAKDSTPGGGSIGVLFHRHYGPVLAATMTKYYLAEESNMQIPRNIPINCQTPGIWLQRDGKEYMSLQDRAAEISGSTQGNSQVITVEGHLAAGENDSPAEPYRLTYLVEADHCIIRAFTEAEKAVLKIPVVSRKEDQIQWGENGELLVDAAGAGLRIRGENASIMIRETEGLKAEGTYGREFNPVGGFTYLPVSVSLVKGEEAELIFSVSDKKPLNS